MWYKTKSKKVMKSGPTYDEAVSAQIEEIKAKKPYHNFAELLETNDIWEVK